MSLLDSIFQGIQTGVSVLNATGQNQPHNNTSITTQINQLVYQLNQLEVGFAALPANQRLQNADTALQAVRQIQQALQALHGTGTDATYLSTTLTVLTAVNNHILQMIQEAQTALGGSTGGSSGGGGGSGGTGGGTVTTPVIDANGQVIYQQIPVNTTTSGTSLSQNDLLLIGGIVLLIFLLK